MDTLQNLQPLLAGRKTVSENRRILGYLRIAENSLTHQTTRIEVLRGVQVMSSRVAVCNEALALLGDKSIVDLGEQTPQGRACAVSYGPALRAVLSVHPWGCATRRAVLPVVVSHAQQEVVSHAQQEVVSHAQNNDSGGVTAWRRLPDDLRVLSPLEGVTLEGRLIVAQGKQAASCSTRKLKKPLQVRYISSDVEPVDLPAPVSDAVVAALAVRLCEKLTGSKNKQADLIQLYDIRLREAVRFDSAQAAPSPVTAQTWLEARL